MSLDNPFVNEHGIIELPGPFFELLKKGYDMTFTTDLVNGISTILPKILDYKITVSKGALRITYKKVDDSVDVKTLVESCQNWELNPAKKVISFLMAE